MNSDGPVKKLQSDEAQPWSIPSMQVDPDRVIRYRRETDKEAEEAESGIPTAEEIEQWRKDAELEGFEHGYQEGLAKARTEMAPVKKQFLGLCDFFQHPLNALNEEVEQQLSQVAVILAQQLVRRELKLNPGEIVGLIRDSVALLPANARSIKIILHPEDAKLFREALSIDQGIGDDEQSWKLIDDAMITRGGCQIKSESSTINLTLEKRLSALAASVMGGEREADQE
ncbi:MAG: flagellar assembly protein FliH [Gammaproteobacteria bacterium]|jgi:flagellar assembly protein FliH